MADIKIFRYPGSKAKYTSILKPYIANTINNSFADVFVGGGSVLLNIASSYPKIQLFANDKDDWVSAFWNIISTNEVNELLKLIQVQPTIELFNELSEKPPRDILEKAYYALFFNRVCFSGIFKRNNGKVTSSPIGGKNQLSKYKVDCRYNAKSLTKNITLAHDLLKSRLVVTNLDFKGFLTDYHGAAYLDPPYVYKSDQLYNITMDMEQHKTLASILNNRSGWVLSYDDCDEVRELYKNCEIIDLSARYSIHGKKSAWANKNELIILPRK